MLSRAALVLLLMAGEAAAAMNPEQVRALLEAEKYSDALREGKQAAEAAATSAEAQHAYGLVLRVVYRREEAVTTLERAHRLAPDDAAIAIELGWALCDVGKLERAREIAATAVKRWPAEAAELQAWLDREVRIRGGKAGEFPAGSASAFAAQVMAKLVKGRVVDVFRNDMDRAVLDRWAADSGDPSATATDEFVAGLAGGIEEAMQKQTTGARLHGYDVSPEAAQRAGRTYVTVTVLMESRLTPQQLAMFEKALADPSLPVPMDPTLAKVLRALEPADRKASLAALAAHSTLDELAVELELSGAAGSWKIADAAVPDGDLRLSRIVEVTRKLWRSGAMPPPEPKRRNRPYDLGYAIGRMVGPVLVILLIVALWRRSRRRKS